MRGKKYCERLRAVQFKCKTRAKSVTLVKITHRNSELWLAKRKWRDRDLEGSSGPWPGYPRKLFLTQRKSRFSSGSLFSETSPCSLASLSGSQWQFVLHYMKSLLFFQTSDRGWPACGRLGGQTSAGTKAFVDMTYISQGLDREPPSLSPHFLLDWLNDNGKFSKAMISCKTMRKIFYRKFEKSFLQISCNRQGSQKQDICIIRANLALHCGKKSISFLWSNQPT